ncbi:hypothetical protein HYALB_00009773 [Hymenoscyphus albidus]|uniref:Tyrosinase copper-binding domain-containing protein n=1 Tax=Hymenoscyphus albidus TaxID=595503 RepID=A0A9N9Q6I5_9HELO|nr:hypothetical protein HYALB_00009773 [Hymenoscyphus albidus]
MEREEWEERERKGGKGVKGKRVLELEPLRPRPHLLPSLQRQQHLHGGNGSPDPYPGIPSTSFDPPFDMISSAGGGGCVESGPCGDMIVSLGPFSKIVSNIPSNPQADGFGSNPRCLRRDVNKHASAVTFDNYTYALITENPTIEAFQANMLGNKSRNDWGVHMGVHYTIGGDPGGVGVFVYDLGYVMLSYVLYVGR